MTCVVDGEHVLLPVILLPIQKSYLQNLKRGLGKQLPEMNGGKLFHIAYMLQGKFTFTDISISQVVKSDSLIINIQISFLNL